MTTDNISRVGMFIIGSLEYVHAFPTLYPTQYKEADERLKGYRGAVKDYKAYIMSRLTGRG